MPSPSLYSLRFLSSPFDNQIQGNQDDIRVPFHQSLGKEYYVAEFVICLLSIFVIFYSLVSLKKISSSEGSTFFH
jgi:hypothetical protein